MVTNPITGALICGCTHDARKPLPRKLLPLCYECGLEKIGNLSNHKVYHWGDQDDMKRMLIRSDIIFAEDDIAGSKRGGHRRANDLDTLVAQTSRIC